MFLEIELLYFIVMIAVFIVVLLLLKIPAGLSLMLSAIAGAILSAIISNTELSLRIFVEGSFGYLDTILVVTAAMVFMGALESCGALDYFSVVIVKAFRNSPTLLLISFMIIIMFPGMITGSSLASVVSAGALVAPIMIKWGIPKAKVGAIIAFGAILGMIAPPINIPVMVICDVVDIPFTGFTLPLLLLAIPLAIMAVLILGRPYVKRIEKEELDTIVNTSILKELKASVVIPLIVLLLLIIGQSIFPRVIGILGTPLLFVIATIPCFFVGRRLPFVKKQIFTDIDTENKENTCVVEVIKKGIAKSFSAMGLLMGVGMFLEVATLNGVRGYFVINALSLPDAWKYVSMAIAMPLFGGISAFGSASILGGPYVMALLGGHNEIIVASALSLIAALGEFLPPTAMSATFASKVVGEKKYSEITKAAVVPLIICLIYGMLFVIVVSTLWR